jgi:Mn2+/Fe2+ NRAMP family transporter
VGQGISEVLPFAIGVAIVPIPVIAVILMLFSSRARVNGPVFLLGWVTGLTVEFVVFFALADAGDASSDSTASDTVSWLKVLLGAALLLLAARTWRKRPSPGTAPTMPKWMAGIDS